MWKVVCAVGVILGSGIGRAQTFNPADFPITDVHPPIQSGDSGPLHQTFTVTNRTDNNAEVQVQLIEGQSIQYRTIEVPAHSHTDFTYVPKLEGSSYSAIPVNAIQRAPPRSHGRVAVAKPKLPTGVVDNFGHMDQQYFELAFKDSGTGSGVTASVASHCSTEALVTITSGSSQLSIDVPGGDITNQNGESIEHLGEGYAFSPDPELFRYTISAVLKVETDSFGNKEPQRGDIQIEDLKVDPSTAHIVGKIKNTGPFPAYVELGFLSDPPNGNLVPASRVHQYVGPVEPYSETKIDRPLDEDFISSDDPSNPPINSVTFPYITYMGCTSVIPSGNKSLIPHIGRDNN